MAALLQRLLDNIDTTKLPSTDTPKIGQLPIAPDADSKQITQSWLWPRLGKFFRPGDVLLADQGTAAFGIPDCRFPRDVKYVPASSRLCSTVQETDYVPRRYICQTYYGSIGYATPSSLGCDIALQELHDSDPKKPRGRTILVTGDGSLMLTMQEISVMVMRKVPVLMCVMYLVVYLELFWLTFVLALLSTIKDILLSVPYMARGNVSPLPILPP